MEIAYYHGNFGDDLNALMWRHVLPETLWAVPDVTIIGIGSILSEKFVAPPLAKGDRVFVMGSGAEYGRLPKDLAKVEIIAVRGPLTAALIGQPDKAAIDAAALLSDIPKYAKKPDGRRVVFMPHHLTARDSRWKDAAKLAGIDYIDPEWETERSLDMIRESKVVIAEAMHAAIVADTLRVPWVPVRMSPKISNFKWRDWTLTVGLPYEPRQLPPASKWEQQRYARMAPDPVAPTIDGADEQSALLADFRARHQGAVNAIPHERPPLVAKLRRLATAGLAIGQRPFDGPFLEAAADGLRRAAEATPYLSDDDKFAEGRDKMRAAVRTLERRLLG